jgi:hypothetical protein
MDLGCPVFATMHNLAQLEPYEQPLAAPRVSRSIRGFREVWGVADGRKTVTPDLEKSFSKQTQDMKNIIDQALLQGEIREVVNRAGHPVELSKIQPRPHKSEPRQDP